MLANARSYLRGALRRVHRDERGMTLPELMIGIGGSTVVLLAGYAAMQVALQSQVRTEDRLEATDRGRLGMERITRDIRSQQCLPGATGENSPAMVIATDRALEFYTSVTSARDRVQLIERRRLEWTPVNAATRGFSDGGVEVGNIVETVWTQNPGGPPYTFPGRSSATQRNIVASDVQQQTPTTPIFQYFGYDPGDIGRPSSTPMPLNPSPVQADLNPQGRPRVSDENIPAVVMVEVRFAARARRGNLARSVTVPFTNRVAVRTADPYDPQRRPFCL